RNVTPGARVERRLDDLCIVGRGEHHHGRAGIERFAELSEGFDIRHARKREVEEHEIDRCVGSRRLHRLGKVAGFYEVERSVQIAQADPDALAHYRMIVDDENSHRARWTAASSSAAGPGGWLSAPTRRRRSSSAAA